MRKSSLPYLRKRLAKARAIMSEAGVDALLVCGNPSRIGGGGTLAHLVGWSPGESYSTLVVPMAGDLVVIAEGPNITSVFNQRLAGIGAAQAYSDGADMAAKTVHALRATDPARIGVAGEAQMSHQLHLSIAAAFPRKTSLDEPLDDMRLVRDLEELAIQQISTDVAEEMVHTAMNVARRGGATPLDIMAETEFRGRQLESENPRLWLATGEHPQSTYYELFELQRTIGPRDRIQIGTTVQMEGYFAQCLRTGVRGTPSRELLDCTARLVEIQDKALAALVPGEPLARLSDVLEAEIDAFCPYERTADPFRFQSCHAIGISYAEPSCAGALNAQRDKSRDAEGPLVTENMVLEIHPNFTLPSLGHVCIGDMALVTATGARWMTNLPRALIRLD